MFNDFVVTNISEKEALDFSGLWKVIVRLMHISYEIAERTHKVPAVLYFERIDLRDKLNYESLPQELDLSILQNDINISM